MAGHDDRQGDTMGGNSVSVGPGFVAAATAATHAGGVNVGVTDAGIAAAGMIASVLAFTDRTMGDETLPVDAPILNLEMLASLRHELALIQIAVTKNDRNEALKRIEVAWSYAAMLRVDR